MVKAKFRHTPEGVLGFSTFTMRATPPRRLGPHFREDVQGESGRHFRCSGFAQAFGTDACVFP